jgi:hypothetical protein
VFVSIKWHTFDFQCCDIWPFFSSLWQCLNGDANASGFVLLNLEFWRSNWHSTFWIQPEKEPTSLQSGKSSPCNEGKSGSLVFKSIPYAKSNYWLFRVESVQSHFQTRQQSTTHCIYTSPHCSELGGVPSARLKFSERLLSIYKQASLLRFDTNLSLSERHQVHSDLTSIFNWSEASQYNQTKNLLRF